MIVKERWHHKFLKSLGLATEISINDQELDEKYFFITDYPWNLKSAMNSSHFREDLKLILSFGIKKLFSTGDKLWCEINKKDFPEDLQQIDKHFEEHYQLLGRIDTDTNFVENGMDKTKKRSTIAICFLCIHAGFLMMGISGGFITGFLPLIDSIELIDRERFYFLSAAIGFIFCIAWLMLIIIIFNRSSWLPLVKVDFILFGMLGIFLTSGDLIRFGNINLSQPDPKIYSQQILNKSCTVKCSKSCGRRCTKRKSYPYSGDIDCSKENREKAIAYLRETDSICENRAYFDLKIEIQHWNKSELYSFNSKETLFDNSKINDSLNAPVHSGAFGIEWLDVREISLPY